MKNIIFAFIILVSSTSFAQNFSAGIKAGANFSNFTGGNFDTVKKKTIAGFHGGVYFKFLTWGIIFAT